MISIIMPVRNEAKVLEKTISSLLRQEDVELEILMVDGMSNDGSREIIRAASDVDPRIILLDNPKQRTPYAFNVGLRRASGDYVAILGAHSEYAPKYLVTCQQELEKHNAAGCSGRLITRPFDSGWQAKLVAWVFVNPFAVSGTSVRTQPEGYVDTIPYPVFRKQVLLDLGGYNETLLRNQDNDMNFRIRNAGYSLYCTWQTSCVYVARRTVKELLNYGYISGLWNAVNMRIDPSSLGLRHYVPLIFVLGLIAGLLMLGIGIIFNFSLLSILGLAASLAIPLHLLLGFVVSLPVMRESRSALPLLMPITILLFHLFYGWGFLRGILLPRSLEHA